MYFSHRTKVVLAIGVFFTLLVGYRVIAERWVAIPAQLRPQDQEAQEQEKKTREQQQVKSLPEKPAFVLTQKQEKEINKIKSQSLIHSGSSQGEWVALTFDDGPDGYFTPRVMNILRKYGIKGTFFVLGNMVKIHPEVLRQIDREGHTIANHSYNHPQFTHISNMRIDKQISLTEVAIFEVIGKKPTLFRTPYGDANKRVLSRIRSRGYKIIQWNIDTNDWRGRSAKQIQATVQQQIQPGCIILQHSNGKRLEGTIEALPRIIEDLKKKGYTFVTVDQMLNMPAYQ